AKYDLTGHKQFGGFAFAEKSDHQKRRHDSNEPSDQTPQPRRNPDVKKTFHHNLPGKCAGKGRVLPRSKERHATEIGRHADTQKRAKLVYYYITHCDIC